MYRKQGVLVLLALYVGLAHSFSWDIVLAEGDQVKFYDNNGTLTHTEVISLNYGIQSMAYDPVNNRLLFAVNNHTDCYNIYSFDIATREIKFIIRNSEHSAPILITYDPVTQLLFWFDKIRRSIISMLSKPGSNNITDINLVINFDKDEEPNSIAVDSCRGYIYWTTKARVQRARFDGSERELLIQSDVFSRGGITIDPQTQKLYWLEHNYRIEVTIESADLNGENRRTLFQRKTFFMPSSRLPSTVSKDFFYWKEFTNVWQLSKNPSRDRAVEPKKFLATHSMNFQIMAFNYKITEQNCEALAKYCDSTDVSLLCVHGKVSGESRCECTQGYIGKRCEVPVCHNYCFQGNCSISTEGQPKCRCNASYSGEGCEVNACHKYWCKAGYSGERCEVNTCHDYCLNNGVCSLNEDSKPVCQCTGYDGERCEVPVFLVKCFQTVSLLRDILNTDVTPATLGKGVKSTCASTAVWNEHKKAVKS